MTRASRRRARTVGLVLLAGFIGGLAGHMVTTAREQSTHVAACIYVCEGSRAWCEWVTWGRHVLTVLVHKPGARWEDNPWVVALSFKTHHANIDEVRG